MKDHLHQPLLFNPAIYNSSDGKQHINYKYITMPQTMLVYAIDNTTGSASRKVSTLIPCSSAEWIIGYNKNNSKGACEKSQAPFWSSSKYIDCLSIIKNAILHHPLMTACFQLQLPIRYLNTNLPQSLLNTDLYLN